MFYDRYVLGSIIVAFGTMGCYFSKWRRCMPGDEMRQGNNKLNREARDDEDDDDDDEERFHHLHNDEMKEFEDEPRGNSIEAPIKRRRQRFRVGFASPFVKSQHLVPALCDIPRWIREEMYWGLEDYAAIRDNQRRLIEVVMRQVREYPQGVVPPPIPGESRRGLGIICEPGTNSGRAARVRGARRAVVEAYRDGYSPEMISKLASELSLWATKNAYQVGLKDHDAVVPGVVGIGDFDLESFRHQQGGGTPALNQSSTSTSPRSPSSIGLAAKPRQKLIARASRRDSEDDDESIEARSILNQQHILQQPIQEVRPAQQTPVSNKPPPPKVQSPDPKQPIATTTTTKQNTDVLDSSMGLASMIRCDSLNDLANHANDTDDTSPTNGSAPTGTEKEAHDRENDGLGLASMIRTDSLGNLAALDNAAVVQSSSQQPSSSDPYSIEAY